MNLPGETEAGSAGRQPWRGITGRAHRADVQQRGKLTLSRCTLATTRSSSDDRPSCLENPRPEGAAPTLPENVASPFHAEPRQPRSSTLHTSNSTCLPHIPHALSRFVADIESPPNRIQSGNEMVVLSRHLSVRVFLNFNVKTGRKSKLSVVCNQTAVAMGA